MADIDNENEQVVDEEPAVNEDTSSEATTGNISRLRYISSYDYQDLIDNNETVDDCLYIVHYDDLPSEIADSPVLETFMGQTRISAVINLDTLPTIDSTRYINSTSLKDELQSLYDTLGETVTKEYIETKLNETVDDLEDADPINTSAIPTNLGISNKLYLYFDRTSSQYEMFIFHPKLKRFIPLKLREAKSSDEPTPTPPTPTPSTTKLILEHSSIVTTPQVSDLKISGETYFVDISSMSTIKFGQPGNSIIVQGKVAFWNFNIIEDYIRQAYESTESVRLLDYITYNNCDIKFNYNNTDYDTKFVADFEEACFKETINSTPEDPQYLYMMNTMNKFYNRNDDTIISDLTKNSWSAPWPTSYDYGNLYGYGALGLTIIVESIFGPNSDPTNYPYGYITGRIYFTITGRPGCTNYQDYIAIKGGITGKTYDSYLPVKIPFASLAEYYFSASINIKSDVVIINE